MNFDIQTPALKTAMDAFEHVIGQTKVGAIESVNAKNMVQAGSGIVSAVGQELKVRLAAPKLAAADAAMIRAQASGPAAIAA